jgi:tetratricopeptide (TPR) repeat protein
LPHKLGITFLLVSFMARSFPPILQKCTKLIFLVTILLAPGMVANAQTATTDLDSLQWEMWLDKAVKLRQSQLDSSYWYAEKVLDAVVNTESKYFLAKTYNILGANDGLAGRFPRNYEYFMRAGDLFEEIGDPIGQANVLVNIGLIHSSLQSYESALENFHRALALYLANKDEDRASRARNNIGSVLLEMDRDTEAIPFLRASISYKLTINDTLGLGHSYMNLGRVYHHLDNPDSAYYYLHRSIVFKKASRDYPGLSNSYRFLGEFFLDQNKAKEAKTYFDRSLLVAVTHQLPSRIYLSHQGLYHYYKKFPSTDSALYHYEQYIRGKEAISGTQNFQQLAGIQNDYFENKLLRKSNELTQLKLESQQRHQVTLIGLIAGLTILVGLLSIALRSNFTKKQALKKRSSELEEINHLVGIQKTELENTNLLKDKLLYFISHNIRGPLATLQGILYLLKNNQISAEEREKSLHSIQNMLTNISGFLDYLVKIGNRDQTAATSGVLSANFSHLIHRAADFLQEKSDLPAFSLQNKVPTDTVIRGDIDSYGLIIRYYLDEIVQNEGHCHLAIYANSTPTEHRLYIRVMPPLQTANGMDFKALYFSEKHKFELKRSNASLITALLKMEGCTVWHQPAHPDYGPIYKLVLPIQVEAEV